MKLTRKQEEDILKTAKTPEKIRNIAIIAHVDHGKTTLTDSLLSEAKLLNKDKAGTELYTDTDIEEKERGVTINSCSISFTYEYLKDIYLFNLADTPGHADFSGEVVRILNGVDGVLLLVDAVEGIMPQTEVVIKHSILQKNKMILVINKIDRLINELNLKEEAIEDLLVTLISNINSFIKNITTSEEFLILANFSLKKTNVILSSGLQKWAVNYKVLEAHNLKYNDFFKNFNNLDFKKQFSLGKTVFESIINEIPNPIEAGLSKNSYAVLKNNNDTQRISAIVLGILYDKFLGLVTLVRVLEGQFKRNTEIYNYRISKFEKVSKLFLVMAEDKIEIPIGTVGNILGITGLSEVKIGDIISNKENLPIIIERISKEPAVSLAIKIIDKKDENKLGLAIQTLLKSDVNFSSRYNEETGQHIIGGIGELHLETTINKLKNHFGVLVKTTPPEIHYLETIKNRSEEVEEISSNRHNRFKVFLFPLPEKVIELLKIKENLTVSELINNEVDKDISKGYEHRFGSCLYFNCSKSVIYYPEIRDTYYRSIEYTLLRGPLRGKILTNLGIVLTDARIHEDPLHRGIAQILPMIRNSITKCCNMAVPLILEPYNKINVFFPEAYLNKVQYCILKRRGIIDSQDFQSGYLSIIAKIPCNELEGLTQEFMDSTGGRVNWSQSFLGFYTMPSNLVNKVLVVNKK